MWHIKDKRQKKKKKKKKGLRVSDISKYHDKISLRFGGPQKLGNSQLFEVSQPIKEGVSGQRIMPFDFRIRLQLK